MNTRRIIFWLGFIIVLALIIWGMIVAANRAPGEGINTKGVPAPITETDNTKGSIDAPVTIIEYSDFECPACFNYYFVMDKLTEENPEKVRFVYRHFPLPQHTQAITASLATEAAGRQGKFWQMYDLVFSNYADWSGKKNASTTFRNYATKLGLDMDQYDRDIADSSLKEKILAQKSEGQKIRVDATPTFFVNNKYINTPPSYAEFKKLIDNTASSSAIQD